MQFDPWVRKIPWRRTGQSAPVFLPGESHGRRSLVGYTRGLSLVVESRACSLVAVFGLLIVVASPDEEHRL